MHSLHSKTNNFDYQTKSLNTRIDCLDKKADSIDTQAEFRQEHRQSAT